MNKILIVIIALVWMQATHLLAQPSGMVLVPAGSFAMGDSLGDNGTNSAELPVHTVYVSAFYMDKYDVTLALWSSVYQWATNHGYSFDYAGSGVASNYPVQTVNWYDSVKWCNARSEMAGLTPCYYIDAAQTSVYRNGDIDITNACVNWSANGYRLPTEAEWEKAARGGLVGRRFPWGDTITHSNANYYGCPTCYSYDLGTPGSDPIYGFGTSPVGSYPPNGYGLYDMSGNVYQWCWDYIDSTYYGTSDASSNNPHGPNTVLSYRVQRGSSYFGQINGGSAIYSRCAFRGDYPPWHVTPDGGFRCVVASSQNPPYVTTQPRSQTAQVESNVTFTVSVIGTTPLNYSWQFNGQNISNATNVNLSLTNVEFSDVGGYSVIVSNAYGSVTSVMAQLTVFTNLAVIQTNQSPPPPGLPTIPTDSTQFRVFTNSYLTNGIGLDPTKDTIVLTHGWKDSSSGWPLEMANDIKFELGANTPNIVAWDWTTAAAAPLATAALNTQGQGYALGEDLAAALGANYTKRIQFIGHSLGTLVNARAANYIHAHGFLWANTQMTLFDEAEIAWGFTGNAWQTVTTAVQDDSTSQPGWESPMPTNCAWAENYITAVGMPQSKAVNVILTNLYPDMSTIQNLFQAGIAAWAGVFQTEDTDYHDYPYIWYENTISQIGDPNAPPYPMGFSRSWDGGGYSQRPAIGTYYIQSTNAPPSFLGYSDYDPDYNLEQITPEQAKQFLDGRPQNLISPVGVDLVNSANNTLANNPSQVQAQLQSGLVQDPYAQTTGPWLAVATLIKLFTQSAAGPMVQNGTMQPLGSPLGTSGAGSPAYAWIPVTVPSNAVSMSFDFMLQGNGNQDSFQVALNNSNLFNVETVLIPTNVTVNSGMIDISQFAGQQAQLFFGIVGGTSTNASVTVSDIAFYVSQAPLLQAQLSGTDCVLLWPVSAYNYALETTTNLADPNSWTLVTNVPAVVNFQCAVTNPISGPSRFYRLVNMNAIMPTLQAQISGNNIILSWPTSDINFNLETTTNLADPNSWTTVSDIPAAVNSQYTVTNQISDKMRFYRLKQ